MSSRLLFFSASSVVAACSAFGLSTEDPAPGPLADAGVDATTDDAASGDAPADALSEGAVTGSKLVFVTSKTYKAQEIGGLAGADAKCNALAVSANKPGTYKAWLSSAAESPNTRFTTSTGPYLRVDTVQVAASYPALTNGPLDNTISINEMGLPAVQTFVWTATANNGAYFPQSCGDWTANDGTGAAGNPNVKTAEWSLITAGQLPCGSSFALYCFQQ